MPVDSPEVFQQVMEKIRPSYADGRRMKELRSVRIAKIEEAHMAGIVPFAVLNFNPTIAQVECAHIPEKIPGAGGKLGIQKRVHVGGIDRLASLLMFEHLDGYHVPISATNAIGDNPNIPGNPSNPDVAFDWKLILPIVKARYFDYTYNNSSDDMGAGGVLAFKGDWHTFERAIRGEDGGIIYVPTTKRGESGVLHYFAQPVALIDKLNEILERQKNYCLRKIQQGLEYAQNLEPALRNSVDGSHRTWAQFAVDRGWADKNQMDGLLLREAGGGCTRCGESRMSGAAMFCKCGKPYDAFAAYMKGEIVDPQYLANLPEEQQEQVMEEAKRRREFAAAMEGKRKKAE